MNWKDKKVLVTGGAGLVGSNLINRLLPLDTKIRATWHTKKPSIVHDKVHYIHCDLTNMEDCKKAVTGMDYVFALASSLGGAGVMSKDSLDMFNCNIRLYTNIFECAYKVGVKRVLFLGSSTSYPESDFAVREEEMWNGEPWDKYFLVGWWKRIGELLCQIYSKKVKLVMPCVVIRPTNIYGPYDNFDLETSHVTPALIRKVLERHNPLEVWGDGTEVRDLIYVDDLIDAMLLAMEKIETYNPINIGSGMGYSVKEILDTILEIEDFHPEIVYDPSKPTMIPKRLVSIEKAERLLSWKPKTSLRDGLTKTIDWYRDSQCSPKCPHY